MKNKILSLLLICFNLFVSVNTFSQERAKFSLIVPAPDPIQAGEKLTFQIITQNTGAAAWKKNSTQFEIEIYDSEKKYITKTDRINPDQDTPAGETLLSFINYDIPIGFSGFYYFRISITVEGEKLAYSDFQSFRVTATERIEKAAAPKFTLNGNAIISYRNDTRGAVQNYTGNTSLNLLGSFYQNAFVLNMYTNHTKDKPFDLYNFVFNYFSNSVDFSVGDIMPYFSVLSLSNVGMRGVYPVIKKGITNTSIVGSRTVEPKEGTGLTPGTYARYLYGIEEKVELAPEKIINISYVESADDKNSILNPVTTIPIKNQVAQIGTSLALSEKFIFGMDFATSMNSSDTVNNLGTVSDTAYKLFLETRTGPLSAKLGHQLIGTDFVSAGSPTILKDRVINDLLLNLGLRSLGGIALAYSDNTDNLKNDPSKSTTNQKIYSVSTSLRILKLQSLTLGYTENDIMGNSTSAPLENHTNVLNAGASYSKTWGRNSFLVSLSGLNSNFKDMIRNQNDNETISATLGTSFYSGDKFSVNLGLNNTNITDLYDKSLGKPFLNKLETYSLTGSYRVMKEKMVMNFLGNTTNRNDNDMTTPAQTTMQTVNLEMTYFFNYRFAWSAGVGQNQYTDKLVAANSYTENRISTRLNLGF